VLYHISVVLSYLCGLEVYDTIYFLVFFFAAIAVLLMYFIIKQFNKNAALIALPISLLVFSGGLYTGFTWGHWPTLVSQFFLIGIFWYTSRIDLEKSHIFLGIFLGATIMTHTSEALFAIIYLILFFIVSSIIARKIEFGLIKNLILGGIIIFVITSYYLVIFKYVWVPRQPFQFGVTTTWDNPTIYLVDFKLLLLFMLAGFIVSLFFIKKSLVPALSSITMLLIGLGNYYGFREKAFQLRFFWPIFLSFLMGFGIYYIFKLIVKEWKLIYSIAISAIIVIVIVIDSIPYVPHYNKLQTNGLMDQYHWEMFKWIEENTEKNSKVYFFYGDVYNQDALLRNSKRHHAQVVPEDFADAINKKEIRRFYETEFPGDGGGGAAQRLSLLSFHFKLDEIESSLNGKKDICNFDYFVFDKLARHYVFAQYNLLIASELAKNGTAKVFENPVLVVMKNNNVGADCIEERNF